jgi:hypothetical protein
VPVLVLVLVPVLVLVLCWCWCCAGAGAGAALPAAIPTAVSQNFWWWLRPMCLYKCC